MQRKTSQKPGNAAHSAALPYLIAGIDADKNVYRRNSNKNFWAKKIPSQIGGEISNTKTTI